jgi:flagellar biosynthesis protein FlhF
MKFKSYSGRTVAELVPQIREELGPDAVILKQRATRSGGVAGFFARTGVEVLAADAEPATPALEAPATPRAHVDTTDAASQADLLRETFSDALEARVRREQALVEEEKVAPAAAEELAEPAATMRVAAAGAYGGRVHRFEPVRIESERTPAGRLRIAPTAAPMAPVDPSSDEEGADLVLELERAGVPTSVAAGLVRDVRLHVEPFATGALRDLVRRRIAGRIAVEHGWAPSGTARRIAIVGASGVGKTTAAANLAAGFATAGLNVGLMIVERIDTGHPTLPRLGSMGGSEADRALAYMAGADISRVSTPADATRAIARLTGRDVVVIDTPGIAADDRGDALAPVLAAIGVDEVHAAVPLGLADREAAAILTRLTRLGANRLLVTKTDEARFAGPLLGLAATYDLALGYLGCGSSVPGGLHPADGGSIATRILPI